MTSFTNVQIAQNTIRNTIRAVALNKWNTASTAYARGYCLSMDEVFLIEQNQQWLAGQVSAKDAVEVSAIDDSTFDYLMYVGEDVACAFTDMKPSELRKAAKAGAQAMRPYRLSDLEKIRVAKLTPATAI